MLTVIQNKCSGVGGTDDTFVIPVVKWYTVEVCVQPRAIHLASRRRLAVTIRGVVYTSKHGRVISPYVCIFIDYASAHKIRYIEIIINVLNKNKYKNVTISSHSHTGA